MRVLIPGGTGFLGAACVRHAMARGHDVTVLTRTGQNVPAGARSIIADRCGPLPPMAGHFDAVIDTKAYQPAMIDNVTDALKDPIPYAYASSISVYDTLASPGLDESTPASMATPDTIAEAQQLAPNDWCNLAKMGHHYGPLKRACEVSVTEWAGNSASCHRLGLICGPGDKTDRLTWWIRTLDQGAATPVPGPASRRIQIVDVEDAAAFMVRAIEKPLSGAYNVTGPSILLNDLLQSIRDVAHAPCTLLDVPEAAIAAEDLSYWTDLPLIVPSDGPRRAMLSVSTERAAHAGLTIRPLIDTITRALVFDRQDRGRPLIAGLTAAQRDKLLEHHNPSG